MKQIIVFSKKHGKKIIKVSDSDFKVVSKFKWSIFAGNTTFYALTTWIEKGKKTTKYLHRLILNAKSNEFIDHIDHDGLNNQRRNIRLCSPAQNSKNMSKHRDNQSGLKGVSLDKRRGNFRSRIKIGNKHVWLGSFRCALDAAHAYDAAAKKHFNQFAKINQIT